MFIVAALACVCSPSSARLLCEKAYTHLLQYLGAGTCDCVAPARIIQRMFSTRIRSNLVPMHVTPSSCAQGTSEYSGELCGAEAVGGLAQCECIGSVTIGLPPRYHECLYDPIQLCVSFIAQCSFGEGGCSSSATAEKSCSGGTR